MIGLGGLGFDDPSNQVRHFFRPLFIVIIFIYFETDRHMHRHTQRGQSKSNSVLVGARDLLLPVRPLLISSSTFDDSSC
jgi:hypothetical protein